MSGSNTNTTASLGCGSLMIIAIIVLIFGNRGDNEKQETHLRNIQSEVKELKAEVATQSATLSRIENELKKLREESEKPSE